MTEVEASGWYIKKSDGEVYGPNPLETLVAWAADGRIAPEDFLSEDGVLWRPAYELPALEMNWFIELEDGERYGPLPESYFPCLMDEGSAPPDLRLVHLRTGERIAIVQLVARLAGRAAEDARAAAARPVPVEGGAAPERTVTWRAMALDKDRFEREAERWRVLYEAEHANARRLEEELEIARRGREEDRMAAETALQHAEREIAMLKRQQEELARSAPGGDAALVGAYRDLSRTFEGLSDQYTTKARLLRAAEEALGVLRKEYEERQELLSAQLARERSATDAARSHLAELEKSHAEMMQSFREMNDRYIRLREQVSSSQPVGVTGVPEAPASPVGQGPRVRLRR